MKIKYIWFDEPTKEKVYDTAKGYEEHTRMSMFLHLQPMTKQEWDDFEKRKIEEKRKQGLVLAYEIIKRRRENEGHKVPELQVSIS